MYIFNLNNYLMKYLFVSNFSSAISENISNKKNRTKYIVRQTIAIIAKLSLF